MKTDYELFYRCTGDGPALLLVHGMGSSHKIWTPMISPLSKHYKVYLIDLPGFGSSKELSDDVPPTIANLCLLIERFIQSKNLEAVFIAGHSIGGAIAIELAKRKTVKAGVAFSPIGFWTNAEALLGKYSHNFWHYTGKLLSPFVKSILAITQLRRIFFCQFAKRFDLLHKDYATQLALDFIHSPGFSSMLKHTSFFFFNEINRDTQNLSIVWGTLDKLVPFRQSKKAKHLFKAAKHISLENCAHLPMNDATRESVEIILNQCH